MFCRIALCASLLPAYACEQKPVRVLLVGDSITVGVTSGEAGLSFAQRIEEHFGSEVELVNRACGGASATDWTLSQPGTDCGLWGQKPPGLFEALAMPELPADFAILLLGTNDAVGYNEPEPVRAGVYGRSLAEVTQNLLSAGAGKVILIAPPHVPHVPKPNWRGAEQRLRNYGRQVRRICSANPRVVCGPDLFDLLDVREHFESQNLHPNRSGHEVIATALAGTLRQEIDALRP